MCSQAHGVIFVPELCCCIAGSRDHARQMLYLEALRNFELQRVAQFLAPIISGDDTKYSHHIRILAMWTSVGHATLQPDQVCYRASHGSWSLILDQLKVLICHVNYFVFNMQTLQVAAMYHCMQITWCPVSLL